MKFELAVEMPSFFGRSNGGVKFDDGMLGVF